jgi:hypothetical protein
VVDQSWDPTKIDRNAALGMTLLPSFSEKVGFEKCNAIFVSGESVRRDQ